MDISETSFQEDFNYIISNLIKFLPKKRDSRLFESDKSGVRHLSNIHAEAKSVFPKCFHGARLLIENKIVDKVRLVQQYNFGNVDKTQRAIMQVLQKEATPKHVDDGLLIDTSRSAIATYTERIRNGEIKMISKIKNLTSSETEVLVERVEEKFTSLTAFSLKDVSPTSLGVLTQYMYKIVPTFCVGGEFGFKPFSPQSTPRFSLSCRYDLPTIALSYTMSKNGLQFCIFKEIARDLRLASIATANSRGTVLSLAVHKLCENDSDLKIFVDSMCCAGITYEKNLIFQEGYETHTILMKISTLVDRQGKFRYGLGFQLNF